jgi:hypothetical protein
MDLPLPPFVTGLIAGLVIGLGVAGYFWFAGWLRRRALVKEVASLKEHLHRQMEINAKGTDAQKKELEALREKTENLRITNATLKQKPGHAEIELLATYERALRDAQPRAGLRRGLGTGAQGGGGGTRGRGHGPDATHPQGAQAGAGSHGRQCADATTARSAGHGEAIDGRRAEARQGRRVRVIGAAHESRISPHATGATGATGAKLGNMPGKVRGRC